jgi:hypothetical protein
MMNTGGLLKIGAVGVGAYLTYKWYTGRTASPATSVAAVAAPTASTGSLQMDSWYSQLKSSAASDSTNFTGSGDGLSGSPDHWAYNLNVIAGYQAPLDSLFGAVGSGGLRDSSITAAMFWSKVAPGLQSTKGLSGLGIYGGLGSLASRAVQ